MKENDHPDLPAEWEPFFDHPALPAEWEPFFDYSRDEVTGETPMCPVCHEPLYELEYCVFCGQPIQMDDKLAEWAKRTTTRTGNVPLAE